MLRLNGYNSYRLPPPTNSSGTSTLNEVIGSKNDTYAGHDSYPSIYSYQDAFYKHIHQEGLCYPDLDDGITINGGAGAWELGAFTEIIPANTITDAYDLHWMKVEAVSANDVYQLNLYKGLAENEILIARVRFVKSTTAGAGSSNFAIQVPVLSANERIVGKLASAGGGDNATISLAYHTY